MVEYVDPYLGTEATPDACPIPSNGNDGVGIASIALADPTHILITLTDNTQYTLLIPTGTGPQGPPGTNGADGTNGTDGSNGTNGTNGTNGSNGAAGATGATGATGLAGVNVYPVSGTPSGGLGNNGDGAVNYTNGITYIKSGGSWSAVGSIAGTNGTNGTNGSFITVSNFAGATPTISANNGDLAIDNSNTAYYYYTGGVWVSQGFLSPANYVTLATNQTVTTTTPITGNKETQGWFSFLNYITVAWNSAAATLSGLSLGNVAGKLLIGNNRSGSMAEVNFWSIIGTAGSAIGGFHWSNLSNDGTVETDLLDINGTTKNLTTYGAIKPGSIPASSAVPTVTLTTDASTGIIVSRTIQQFRTDLGLSNNTTAPALTAGTGAGTSPVVSKVGNNSRGVITVTTGTSPSASAKVFTFTMGGFSFPNLCCPVLYPNNVLSLGLGIFVTNATNSGFEVWVNGTPLAGSTTYQFIYDNGGF